MRTYVSATAKAIFAVTKMTPFFASAHDLQVDSLGNEGISLHEVTVVEDKMRHMNEAVKLGLKTNSVRSPQEVLRIVPGLLIAQHAGGGKSEHMFLRGYDLDHKSLSPTYVLLPAHRLCSVALFLSDFNIDFGQNKRSRLSVLLTINHKNKRLWIQKNKCLKQCHRRSRFAPMKYD